MNYLRGQSRLLLVTSTRPQVAWNLTGIAQSIGIEPWQAEERKNLADLVYGLEKAEYLTNIIMPQLRGYPWSLHEIDPAKVIKDMEPVWDILGGDIKQMPSKFKVERMSSFAECLAWWIYCISEETGEFMPPLEFPETQAHRDAFAYVLFLFMWLRDGPAPEIVSGLYIDALKQVGLDTKTRERILDNLRG
ncbi:hypothetical protein EKO27_g5626 [Xylaria grammica]|uniref:Uncharacterized protein n=1 Tax=Xylaria grammica TaxID=363999 RepID=A0A439D4W4_9PEZI|nr:hypothetical protein EKO27_g5626 [Xylaria grammica]